MLLLIGAAICYFALGLSGFQTIAVCALFFVLAIIDQQAINSLKD